MYDPRRPPQHAGVAVGFEQNHAEDRRVDLARKSVRETAIPLAEQARREEHHPNGSCDECGSVKQQRANVGGNGDSEEAC